MNLKRIFPLLTLLLATPAISFAGIVKGSVFDKEGLPLPGTSVQIISLPDSTRVSYQLTGDNGDFSFSKIKKGSYAALFDMAGMDRVSKDFEITEPQQTVDLGKSVLSESAVTLKETVVTAIRAAVVAKQDTLEFNAGSFKTAPNATVNDLLKKLPGVEIGDDGSIKSNGKSISKILVDGKEFFGDDIQAATKNLPSNMVDRVQVVDRKSELARMTGVDDGEEETVINLAVKKNMNNGWFGNVGGAYGTDSRYRADLSVNNFKNGNQVSIIGGANNVNQMGMSDRGKGMFRDFGNGGGINNSQRLGLNFNVGNEEIFRVGGNVAYTHSERKSTRRSETQFLYSDYNNYQSAGSRTTDKGHNISSDFRIQWKPNEYNTFDFRPNFRLNFRDAESTDSTKLFSAIEKLESDRINRNFNSQNNHGANFSTGGNMIFNHNFASRPGRSFSVQADYSFSNNRQKATTWSDIIYYLENDKDQELYRFIDNHTWSNSFSSRLTWTEPLGDVKKGNFIEIAYRLRYNWNNADKLTYNLDNPSNPENFMPGSFDNVPVDLGAVLDNDISNSFRNKYFNQELQLGYKKVTKSLNLNAGVLFTPSMSKSEDLIKSERNIPERWVFNVSPFARIRYKFNKNSSMRLNYNGRTSQPSMAQLQPVADVSNPLNIVQGNPDLKPTFTQSIRVNYQNYTPSTQQAINAMLNFQVATNTIVNKTVTDRNTGGRTTTYENANGQWNMMGMFMVNQPFRNRRLRFNARMFGNYMTAPGYINGDFNRTNNLSLSPSAGMTFSNDIVQISFNPEYSFSLASNTLQSQKDRRTHSYGFRSDASLNLPFGLTFNTDLRFANATGYAAGYDSKTWLWNAELAYSFLNDRSLTFSVKAYDLLGQNKNISRSVSANQIVDAQYNDLTRYVTLGLTWSFSTLKKKGKGPTGEDIEFGPGMQGPPPGGGRPQGPPPGGGGGMRHF